MITSEFLNFNNMKFMKPNMKNLLSVLTLILLFGFSTYASHIPGGNLTYTCTGTPNQYLLTMESQ